MRTKLTSSIMLILMGIAIMVNVGITQVTSVIKLQPPQLDRGKPLMQALNERQSNRQFSPKPLSLQTLSNLLWAADGINRPESGKRTAPSAMNQQEIDIYVVMKEGIYRYDPKEHALHLIAKGDLRNLCGRQEFVAQAPVNLIYVADYRKMAR
ncbi:MAG: SagB/ThcOx family dehydrogenase, partial [Candidatus Marinimicrobia bacterium]|nr:SagB/ThcOx family dehydrogenase [Candidatus Neomarinimicrobiota bacterium]